MPKGVSPSEERPEVVAETLHLYTCLKSDVDTDDPPVVGARPDVEAEGDVAAVLPRGLEPYEDQLLAQVAVCRLVRRQSQPNLAFPRPSGEDRTCGRALVLLVCHGEIIARSAVEPVTSRARSCRGQ
jgi:hypothetical protein